MSNVLVVDDSRIMRINIKKMLESIGHKVIAEATNGYEAIEKYKQNCEEIDLVTMDITMPIINDIKDGIDAVKHIIKFDSNAKIIMLTSLGEQQEVIKAVEAGASNYLLKPIQVDKLTEALSKLNI